MEEKEAKKASVAFFLNDMADFDILDQKRATSGIALIDVPKPIREDQNLQVHD